MIEYFAAHKLLLVVGMAAISVALILRHRSGSADAAALPAYAVNPYSSTPPAATDSGSLALPYASPYAGAGAVGSSGDPSPAAPGEQAPPVADSQVSTGPGAGPTIAAPISAPVSYVAPSYPAPDSPGAPGTPEYLQATTGVGAVQVPDGSGGSTTLVGIDARMAHPSPAQVQAAAAASTAAAENYAHQFAQAAQGSYTAGF